MSFKCVLYITTKHVCISCPTDNITAAIPLASVASCTTTGTPPCKSRSDRFHFLGVISCMNLCTMSERHLEGATNGANTFPDTKAGMANDSMRAGQQLHVLYSGGSSLVLANFQPGSLNSALGLIEHLSQQ